MNLSAPLNPRLADTDALRTKLVRGDLLPRPFESGHFNSADSSGATAIVNATIINKDGSGSALVVNVPAGTNGARIQVPFFGRAFGITFRRSQGAGFQIPAEFSVRVDGVAYAVSTALTKALLYGQVIEDDQTKVLVCDDLPEGEHYAEITLVAPLSGTDQIYLQSYLVERRAGYLTPIATDVVLTPATGATVPTVAATIYDALLAAVPAGTFGIGRRVSSVHYHNNTGGVAVVTITYNSNLFRQLTIADKDAAVVSFSPAFLMNSTWKHSSPSGGANLPYFVFGSY